MDGETCIDGHPRGMGYDWRGDSCQTGQYFQLVFYTLVQSRLLQQVRPIPYSWI